MRPCPWTNGHGRNIRLVSLPKAGMREEASVTATLLHDSTPHSPASHDPDQHAPSLSIVPALAPSPIEASLPPRRRWWWALDRTAVLALGVLAGFLIGVSFNATGRGAIWATVFPDDARPIALVAPPASMPPAPPLRPGAIDPRVIRRVATDGEIRVGVFGDSFGDGLWAGLYHQLPEKRHFQVFRFGKEATGFTRYRTLNLEDRAREQVAHQPIDVAVISYGANDIQPIFAEGHLRLLMSDAWQRIIGERIDRFVSVARSTGASVYWIGLPAMRDPALDANVVAMNAFYQRRMQALRVPFLETRSRTVDRTGQYAAYLPDSVTGEPRLMRAGDGVHMSMLGYDRLTLPLAEQIRRYAAAARAAARRSGPATPALIAAMQEPPAKKPALEGGK